jgi:hypothetical protein
MEERWVSLVGCQAHIDMHEILLTRVLKLTWLFQQTSHHK